VRRLVLLVGAIVLVDTMFYAAITPLLPKLVDDLDLGKNGAGVLTGAYAAGTLLGSLPAGWLIAKFGVKPTVIVGLTLMSVSCLVFAFAKTIGILDAARFLQGFGGACSWAGGMAWVAGEAPRERRGALLGSAMGFAIFGVQLGPVVGAVARGVGQDLAFASAALFGLALGVWAWTVPVRRAEGDALATPVEALRSRPMLAGMWLTALPAAAFGVLDVLAPLRLDALGATALGLAVTFFTAAGVEAIVTPAVGRYTDRAGAKMVIRGGLTATVAALVVLQLPGTVVGLAIVVVGVSGLLGVLWVPAMGLLTGGAEKIGLDHGFAFAYFNLAWAAGFSLGAFAGGTLAELTSDGVAYAGIAVLYAISALYAVLGGPGSGRVAETRELARSWSRSDR
jgi:MFS family permease